MNLYGWRHCSHVCALPNIASIFAERIVPWKSFSRNKDVEFRFCDSKYIYSKMETHYSFTTFLYISSVTFSIFTANSVEKSFKLWFECAENSLKSNFIQSVCRLEIVRTYYCRDLSFKSSWRLLEFLNWPNYQL